MRRITNKEFDELVVKYTNRICSDIIKNGFEGVSGHVRMIMAEETFTNNLFSS